MKKITAILSCLLVLALAASAFAADVSVMLNGAPVVARDANGNEVSPFIEDGTTYVPVRAVAAALGVSIDWDGDAKAVLIGDCSGTEPEPGESVGVYINGKKFNPTDANGKAVSPQLREGITYLPVRAIAQLFAKKVDWDEDNSVVSIIDSARVDTNKTYKIVLHDTNSVILPAADNSGAALKVGAFGGSESELWSFVPVDGQDGFYQIKNVKSGCAMDVNGASRAAGAKLLQYNAGEADNQIFMLVKLDNGAYKIISKNSMLPIENSAGSVKQNIERDSSVQEWDIVEAEATAQEKTAEYKTLRVMGGTVALTYSTEKNDLTAEYCTGEEAQQWTLEAQSEGNYAVNTRNGGRSIDVANNSTTDGDPIITYASSSDDNQRWSFEKQESGGYKIKSVSSELYITVLPDGGVVQTAEGTVFEVAEV